MPIVISRVKPYAENIQTFAAMFDGYEAALERLETAAKGKDPTPAFIALFEALNWAVALDDRAGEHWTPDGGEPLGFGWRDRLGNAEIMRPVRFARNNVHHQWSDALFLDERSSTFPLKFPVVFFEWRWHALSQLPARPAPPSEKARERRVAEEATYRRLLEGRPARITLRELGKTFYFLRQLLEPATLPRGGRLPITSEIGPIT